ncbi:MAG: hypothetical protein IPL46_27380 [Saprospiraceae bacterium]|nr:hypothetical protein [Saprospiraceae bacterium]
MQKKNRLLRARTYRPLADEDTYWNILKEYAAWKYRKDCIKGLLFLHMNNDKEGARKYLHKLANECTVSTSIARLSIILPGSLLRLIFHLIQYK